MRNGRKNWSKYLYTQGSCKYYEKTSVKFYAANSLGNMESQYVSRAIQREAVVTKYKAKRKVRVTQSLIV